MVGMKRGRGRSKITLIKSSKKWYVNLGGDKEYDFGYYRMVKKNICEWLDSKLRCFGEWSLTV